MRKWRLPAIAALAGAPTFAWLALAAPSPALVEPAAHASKAAAAASTLALDSEIARLHDRLKPTAPVLEPGRNLFEFNRAAARIATSVAGAPPRAATTSDALPMPSPPAMRLVGVVQDTPGAARAAVISAPGGPFFVAKGDTFAIGAAVYAVDEVMDDHADVSLIDGTHSTRLPLK